MWKRQVIIMRQFKTVLKFEYLNFVKSKSFVGFTVFLMALIIILASIPNIVGLFSSVFGSGAEDEGGAGTDTDMEAAAFYDPQDMYTPEILSAYYMGYNWIEIDSPDDIEDLIDDGTYALAVTIDGLDIDVYQSGSDSFFEGASDALCEMVTTVYQSGAMSAAGLTEREISDILSVEPNLNVLSVGRDLSQSYWISYALLFLLYFTIMMYGQSVTVSVVTEKSSKAMELLISSARPLSLMFGKVIGTGLAGLTQFLLIVGTLMVSLRANLSAWKEFFPAVASVFDLSLSANLFIYAIIFFLLGFFTFAFVYAALASTVSRMEDASGAQMIPMFLFIAAFMVAVFGLTTPDALYIRICSFVPFLSPLIMFMRICTTEIPTFQIFIAIGLNIVYIWITGFISSKIYKVGVMLYGNKPSPITIIKLVRNARA